MQLSNQAFYFFCSIIVFTFFLGQLRFDGARSIKIDDSTFWPLALLLQALGNFAFFLSGFEYSFFLAVGNVGLVSSGMAITLLIYAWVHPGSRNIKYFPLVLLGTFGIFEILVVTTPLSISVLTVSLVSSLVYFYALVLLRGMKPEHGNKIHFRILRIALVVKIFLLLVGPYFVLYSDVTGTAIYPEQGTTSLVRILGVGSNLLLYIAILNILYQKLWLKAENKAKNIESQMLGSLNALAMARDNETGNHIIRTQQYVKRLALRLRKMGHYVNELSDQSELT